MFEKVDAFDAELNSNMEIAIAVAEPSFQFRYAFVENKNRKINCPIGIEFIDYLNKCLHFTRSQFNVNSCDNTTSNTKGFNKKIPLFQKTFHFGLMAYAYD